MSVLIVLFVIIVIVAAESVPALDPTGWHCIFLVTPLLYSTYAHYIFTPLIIFILTKSTFQLNQLPASSVFCCVVVVSRCELTSIHGMICM